MAGDTNKKKLVGRHKRVAFMDVAGDGKTFTRMTGHIQLRLIVLMLHLHTVCCTL